MAWLTPQHFRLSRSLAAFFSNDGGGVTVFAVIAFGLLVVATGLVFDVGRVMNVHSQTQSYADRVALAAAAELDGRPCAISHAVETIRGFGSRGCPNAVQFQIPDGRRLTLSGDDTIRVESLSFFSSLSPERRTAIWRRGSPIQYDLDRDEAHYQTRFVRVQTTRETEEFLFFPILGGSVRQTSVVSLSTAKFDRRVCNSIPLFVCNPDEREGGGGRFRFDNEDREDLVPSLHYANSYYDWRSRNNLEYGLLQVAAGQTLHGNMESSNPGTICYSDRARVERDFTRDEADSILDGLRERIDDRLSIAIINCRAHLAGNQPRDSVPIEAWADFRLERTNHQNHEESDPPHEHFEIDIDYRGPISRNPPQGTVREYPVLVR